MKKSISPGLQKAQRIYQYISETNFTKKYSVKKTSTLKKTKIPAELWLQTGINEVVCTKIKKKLNSPTSLIDEGKTITNQKNISEQFNKFLIEIGTNIQNKTPT